MTNIGLPSNDAILVIDSDRAPSLRSHLVELWEFRELIWFLILRDIKSKYKSAPLGVFWVIFQPLVKAVTLSLCLAKTGVTLSENVPYPLFAFSGLIVWEYVSGVITSSVGGATSMTSLIRRVYFPKAVIPITITLVPLFDLLVSLSMFLLILLIAGKFSVDRLLFAIPFLFLAYLSALGLAAWFCALSLRFLDFRHLSGLITQVLMFGSPVFYSISVINPEYRALWALNPLSTAIGGFRWSLFGQVAEPQFQYISWLSASIIALTGGLLLHRLSSTIADTV